MTGSIQRLFSFNDDHARVETANLDSQLLNPVRDFMHARNNS